MVRNRLSGFFQSAIQGGADLAGRNRAINFFPVDKHGRGCRHAEIIRLFHRRLHRAIVLSLDARLQLHSIQIVLLALQQSDTVEGGAAGVGVFSLLTSRWLE